MLVSTKELKNHKLNVVWEGSRWWRRPLTETKNSCPITYIIFSLDFCRLIYVVNYYPYSL